MRQDFLHRIYKLKTTIVALVSFGVGIALLVLSRTAANDPSLDWLAFWPLGEIGGTLTAAGMFGIAWDYVDGQDKEAREDERIRRLLKESAPEFRDAVVQGFAVNSEDLQRVATPELLDGIATNVLALRLGDRQFAEEIYADVRDQAIRAPERWYDVDASIRLSSIDERSTFGAPRFEVLVKWEYTVVPSHAVQRFACLSDRDELHELVAETPSTIPWLMTPRPGFDARSEGAFALLEYRVDGEKRSIRRAARKSGQIYTAGIGEDLVNAGKPVRISYLYRTITPRSGHRLFFEVTQPTRGLSLDFDYSDTEISHMSVTDLVSSAERTRVAELPSEVDARSISVDLPGWLLPRAGFAFVWTLASELPPTNEADSTSVPAPAQDAA
ncbi:MAG: hypothetical protein ABIR57_15320 [Aeromicrobium sp.]